MATLKATLGDKAWLAANRDKLRELLPETWTLASNFNLMAFGFQMKLLDVDWRTQDDLGRILVFLERVGILKRDGNLIRRCN